VLRASVVVGSVGRRRRSKRASIDRSNAALARATFRERLDLARGARATAEVERSAVEQ
jgi:hypothetical protein